jgi:hypothetical protein
LVLACLLLLAVSGLVTHHAIPPVVRDPAKSIGDTELQLRTIERLRRGERYYEAVGTELRINSYPTSPIINWRTPLHYRAMAAMSVEHAGTLLFVLGMAVVVTGAIAYARESMVRAGAAAVLLLLSMAPAMLVRPGAVGFPEHWAAAFIGLSLSAYIARLWLAGAAFGIVAVFLREVAGAYAFSCALIAFKARRRAESLLWTAGGVTYFVFFAIHANAAARSIQPDDLVRESSYLLASGLPFIFATLYVNGLVNLLPTFMTPIAAALGLAGSFAPSCPPQLSMSVIGYFLLFCLAGQPFNFYWGYLTSPIWGHAFVHSLEGLRRLVVRARGPHPA